MAFAPARPTSRKPVHIVPAPKNLHGLGRVLENKIDEALEFDYVGKSNTQALKELKEAAYNLGCNAVIGVDFDYITLEPVTVNAGGRTLYLPYVFCVTANGNAVIIEKE